MSGNIPSGPSDSAVAVVPTDGLVIPRPRWIYVGVAGDIACTVGNPVLYKAGVGRLDIAPTVIASTGTTATNIIAQY